jgi:hypothetical protein
MYVVKAAPPADTARSAFHVILYPEPGHFPSATLRVLLDTNVVSYILSFAIRGYDAAIDSHCKVERLVRWLHSQNRSIGVDIALSTLEGASFHLGGVDPYNVIRRAAAVKAVLALDPDEFGNLVAAPRPLDVAVTAADDARLREQIVSSLDLLPAVYFPAYATALLVQSHARSSGNWVPPLRAEFLGLAEQAGMVSDIAAAAMLAILYGRRDIRELVLSKLFKVATRHGEAGAARSVGWDLAHLESMTLAGAISLIPEVPGRIDTACITNDNGLADFAACLQVNMYGRVRLSRASLETRDTAAYSRDLRILNQFMVAERVETWTDTLRQYIADKERELGIAPSTFRAVAGLITTRANWHWIRFLLDHIVDRAWSPIIDEIQSQRTTNDALIDTLHWSMLLLHEDARARGVSEREIAERLFGDQSAAQRGIGRDIILAAAAGLAPGVLQENESSADPQIETRVPSLRLTAILQAATMTAGLNALATLDVIDAARAILIDIADAREATPEAVAGVLKSNIDSRDGATNDSSPSPGRRL